MPQQLSCLRIRGCVAHVSHKFRLHLLMAILTLSLAELMFFVLYSLPLSQHWPEKEMMCMLGATAATLAAVLRIGQIKLLFFSKDNGNSNYNSNSNNNNDHNTAAAPPFWGQALSAAMASTQVLLGLFLAAIVAPQSALLYLTPAALDLLLLLLQRPKGLLGSPQQSATRQQQHQHQQQQQQQVATSRNADIEEYPMPTWNVWQQRDRSHYGQAVKIKNFTWPSRGTRALDDKTRSFEVSTCMICLADFVAGEFLSSLPCGHSFHAACITGWQQHSRHNNSNNNTNSHNNHSVCPCRCMKSRPWVPVGI
ncbi:unnamed protein product [Polarella glacialis]|uniref:RING-type domain-containing protein n=1 Tax=Polarella glacialis TaxID=89957 RepID=A0A813ECS2_POLGL|nr:unnamed protein product [Polarella glacialis]